MDFLLQYDPMSSLARRTWKSLYSVSGLDADGE